MNKWHIFDTFFSNPYSRKIKSHRILSLVPRQSSVSVQPAPWPASFSAAKASLLQS